MIKKLIGSVLLLACVAAVVLYFLLRTGVAYGITDAAPLGQVKRTEAVLTSVGLEPSSSALDGVRSVVGSDIMRFAPPGASDVSEIRLLVDGDGLIQEFTAVITLTDAGGIRRGNEVRLQARAYWLAVVGGLDSVAVGDSITSETDSVKAMWRVTAGDAERVSIARK